MLPLRRVLQGRRLEWLRLKGEHLQRLLEPEERLLLPLLEQETWSRLWIYAFSW